MDTHTIVVGAGTGGATVAGLLAEHGSEPVLLLEAGPDYGPRALRLARRHARRARRADVARLGPHERGTYPDRVLDFPRAKLVGGCSAHNGCTAAVGAHADWDGWAAAGATGWGAADIEPLLDLVRERFKVRQLTLDELTPIQRAFVDAGLAQGLPLAHDLQELTAGVGIGPMAANVVDGVRYNAAFAFLDGVRDRLTIEMRRDGRARVDRSRPRGGVVVDGREIRARRVIVAGGAYLSPAILLRSGIGPADDLRALGIDVVADLPGVGANLLDHPCVAIEFEGSTRSGPRWPTRRTTRTSRRSAARAPRSATTARTTSTSSSSPARTRAIPACRRSRCTAGRCAPARRAASRCATPTRARCR